MASCALALVVAACGPAGIPQQEESGDFVPVTIKHRLGTAEITSTPQRVVTLGFGDLDVVTSLGMTPVAAPADPWNDTGVWPWLEGRLDANNVTWLRGDPASLDYEAIAALGPDLILAQSVPSIDEIYPRLSQIAPTVADQHGVLSDSWQDQALVAGRALGMQDKVHHLITVTERKITESAQAHPGLKGKTYAIAMAYAPGTAIVMADPEDVSGRIFAQLGLSLPDKIRNLPRNPGSAYGANGANISFEQLDVLDSTTLLFAYQAPDLKRSVEPNAVFKGLPAVREGTYLAIDMETTAALRAPTLSNIPWVLERLEPLLAKVAG
ncbi:iron ABC transporter substrate-binding protein [Longimycelium tulufanense]|uniref:Iron ABC transporter substrate-binding protein n=1 Tax=Longimycelium tulufanense TaxID=907463 RepID=A0A8J3FTT0_9PSEU|nr:iron-siderophore ABC transporter substrate-binding protein [Longimycelium tulufanense]GGM49025.1 iron ABC transporter substrate-binding protein [Longimycelium tulufanense]